MLTPAITDYGRVNTSARGRRRASSGLKKEKKVEMLMNESQSLYRVKDGARVLVFACVCWPLLVLVHTCKLCIVCKLASLSLAVLRTRICLSFRILPLSYTTFTTSERRLQHKLGSIILSEQWQFRYRCSLILINFLRN